MLVAHGGHRYFLLDLLSEAFPGLLRIYTAFRCAVRLSNLMLEEKALCVFNFASNV